MFEPEEKVVCEIPVYLSKSLSKKLYLVQYPQRPATVATDKAQVAEIKIKPGQDKIQMTLGVETDSPYYDEFHGELLAEAAEGLGFNEDEYIPDTRKKVDKTVLESTCHPKLTNPSRYVAGIIKDGSVHLTPMKAIVQMKNTLPYLNKAETARAKHENAGALSEEEAEEEATKVTVKFRRNPMDPNKPTSSKSSFSARKKDEEEPWIPLEYTDNNQPVYNQLCTDNMDNDVPMYLLTQRDYLSKLFPKHLEAVIDGSDSKTKSQSVSQRVNIQAMKDLPFPEQLKALMMNGRVMRYDKVVDYFRRKLCINPDETTMLRTIQTVAVLVQGCWVVRSELVYPDSYKSHANGISGTVMQAARDTVLSIFTEQRFIERRKVAPIVHLPNEELTEILSGVSNRIVRKGWEFMLPYDNAFISKYTETVQRQLKIWEVKNQHRNRKISDSSKDILRPPARSPPRRRHSRTMSYSSDNDSGTESENRGRRASGGGSGRQRRPSSRSASESSLLGVPSKVES